MRDKEQREADRPEIKDGFSFMDKETYDSLPLTRWTGQIRQTDRRSSWNYLKNLQRRPS